MNIINKNYNYIYTLIEKYEIDVTFFHKLIRYLFEDSAVKLIKPTQEVLFLNGLRSATIQTQSPHSVQFAEWPRDSRNLLG